MTQSPPSSYASALAELRMIRNQLVPGRARPEEVEALTSQAARVVSAARAALRRASTGLELLEETASNVGSDDIARRAP